MNSVSDTSHDLKKVIEPPEATIYQGDALRVLRALPDCSVDAVLTDPPYSSGGVHLSAKLADPGTKYQRSDTVKSYPALFGDHKDQRSHAYWSTLWLAECWRVTKDGGTTAIAAIKTGRKSIGIELSAEYAAIAAARVREAQHQRGLLSLAV